MGVQIENVVTLSSGLEVDAVKSAGLLTLLDLAVIVGLDALANGVLTVTLAVKCLSGG